MFILSSFTSDKTSAVISLRSNFLTFFTCAPLDFQRIVGCKTQLCEHTGSKMLPFQIDD
ncbi:unnamed protein product [Schistosoma mattheei]|uniref:Uncharacterized protein n=1 Tax=Schistosoma mattheei TaxID=31246 RepID=A0A3P8BP54_9TREM|nr:unnamed protein product [Schistosoma mattheei]